MDLGGRDDEGKKRKAEASGRPDEGGGLLGADDARHVKVRFPAGIPGGTLTPPRCTHACAPVCARGRARDAGLCVPAVRNCPGATGVGGPGVAPRPLSRNLFARAVAEASQPVGS